MAAAARPFSRRLERSRSPRRAPDERPTEHDKSEEVKLVPAAFTVPFDDPEREDLALEVIRCLTTSL